MVWTALQAVPAQISPVARSAALTVTPKTVSAASINNILSFWNRWIVIETESLYRPGAFWFVYYIVPGKRKSFRDSGKNFDGNFFLTDCTKRTIIKPDSVGYPDFA